MGKTFPRESFLKRFIKYLEENKGNLGKSDGPMDFYYNEDFRRYIRRFKYREDVDYKGINEILDQVIKDQNSSETH